MKDSNREAFEEWAKANGYHVAKNPIGEVYLSLNCNNAWEAWQAAKAQAVQEGFVLVSKDKLHEWKCMARRSEELGCPDCYESRGYSHNLAEEIEVQEQNQ